jgi:hypothetical protein
MIVHKQHSFMWAIFLEYVVWWVMLCCIHFVNSMRYRYVFSSRAQYFRKCDSGISLCHTYVHKILMQIFVITFLYLHRLIWTYRASRLRSLVSIREVACPVILLHAGYPEVLFSLSSHMVESYFKLGHNSFLSLQHIPSFCYRDFKHVKMRKKVKGKR